MAGGDAIKSSTLHTPWKRNSGVTSVVLGHGPSPYCGLLKGAWEIRFPDGSLAWLPHLCWWLAWHFSSSPWRPLIRLLDCSHNTAAGFFQEKGSKREQGRSHTIIYDIVLAVMYHHFCNILLNRSDLFSGVREIDWLHMASTPAWKNHWGPSWRLGTKPSNRKKLLKGAALSGWREFSNGWVIIFQGLYHSSSPQELAWNSGVTICSFFQQVFTEHLLCAVSLLRTYAGALPEKPIPGAQSGSRHTAREEAPPWVVSRRACLPFILAILLNRGSQEMCHPEQHFCPLFVCCVMTLFHMLCLNGWTPLSHPSHWS